VYRFWDRVTKPIFMESKPKKIVEIGAGMGMNTQKILEYCKAMDAHLTVIDPAPQFDEMRWKEEYENHFTMMKQLSLYALPSIDKLDMVLIDGDHNWYTVYNELKLIEKKAREQGKYPIVLLHDTEWPYGRRDMYYFPDTIPEEYRHPYDQKGILPGVTGLVENGGINEMLFNATYEFGERNGVLTAIEDYLRETEWSLSFYRLYHDNGLGIIVPNQPDLNKAIQYILSTSGSPMNQQVPHSVPNMSLQQYPL